MQVQKTYIFMETFGPSEINPEKANILKTTVNSQVSNDSLAYFLMLLLISRNYPYASNYSKILRHKNFGSFLHSS